MDHFNHSLIAEMYLKHFIHLGSVTDPKKQKRCLACQTIIPAHVFANYGTSKVIPCLMNRLTDEQKKPNGFHYGVIPAVLKCCGKECFFVEVMFVNADVKDGESVFLWFDEHLFCAPEGRLKSFMAEYRGVHKTIPKNWFVQAVATDKGLAHRHVFGPFDSLKKDDFLSSYCDDYCGCGPISGHGDMAMGSELLKILWSGLKGLSDPAPLHLQRN